MGRRYDRRLCPFVSPEGKETPSTIEIGNFEGTLTREGMMQILEAQKVKALAGNTESVSFILKAFQEDKFSEVREVYTQEVVNAILAVQREKADGGDRRAAKLISSNPPRGRPD